MGKKSARKRRAQERRAAVRRHEEERRQANQTTHQQQPPASPETSTTSVSDGGSGGPYTLPGKGLKDARLEQRALLERWPLEEQYRQALLNRQITIGIDPNSTPKEASIAFRCCLSADGLNLDYQREHSKAKHGEEGLGDTPGGVATIEAVAMQVVQNITMNFTDRELNASQLLAAAQQLREQAAAIQTNGETKP
jgi:hypothetical protein